MGVMMSDIDVPAGSRDDCRILDMQSSSGSALWMGPRGIAIKLRGLMPTRVRDLRRSADSPIREVRQTVIGVVMQPGPRHYGGT